MTNCKCHLSEIKHTPWYNRGAAVAALLFLVVGLALSVLYAIKLVNVIGLILAILDIVAAAFLGAIDAMTGIRDAKTYKRPSFMLTDEACANMKGPLQ